MLRSSWPKATDPLCSLPLSSPCQRQYDKEQRGVSLCSHTQTSPEPSLNLCLAVLISESLNYQVISVPFLCYSLAEERKRGKYVTLDSRICPVYLSLDIVTDLFWFSSVCCVPVIVTHLFEVKETKQHKTAKKDTFPRGYPMKLYTLMLFATIHSPLLFSVLVYIFLPSSLTGRACVRMKRKVLNR